MNKSLVLLASFAGLVACFGEKKEEATPDGQTTTETCPADVAAAPAVEEKKPEAAAATETPVTTTEPTTTAQ